MADIAEFVMAHYDSQHIQDLRERIEYELFTLNFVRNHLYQQDESADSYWSFNLREVVANPTSFMVRASHSIIDKTFEQEVREALTHFVPLSFACAFKVNDMVAEWILGTQNKKIPFGLKDKMNLYEDEKGKLTEPPFFEDNQNVKQCFWKLYELIRECRNSVTHRYDFELLADGALKFTSEKCNCWTLSFVDLGAYTRFTCLLAAFLLDSVPAERRAYAESVFNNDLSRLQKYHAVDLSTAKPARLVDVVIMAHELSDGLLQPSARFNIPLVPIWNRLRKDLSFDGKVDVLPLLKVTAEDENERLVWTIPPELVPDDVIELDRLNRQWSRFLRVEKVNRKKTLQ
jgi:hypothetical protein